MPRLFTLAEVAKHTSREDVYIILGDSVYNVSSFIEEHPGGEEILLELAGQDATEGFNEADHTERAHEILSELSIGKVDRVDGDPAPLLLKGNPESAQNSIKEPRNVSGNTPGFGVMAYIIAIPLAALIASTAYQYYKYKELQP